jgi:DNA (cytosine-5)-methyltransferase 1
MFGKMNAIELFSGAGGLALGVAQAGFSHKALIELDNHSVTAMRTNIARDDWPHDPWNVIHGDISRYTFEQLRGQVDLVSGGPPCQPFSIGGKHRAYNDTRDMFPQAARIISEVQPKAFIFENVRGLTRESFKNYFQYILMRLRFPEESLLDNETWSEHLGRLERLYTSDNYAGLRYRVVSRVLNAADYGVPQSRHRVFMVGFRSDISQQWSFPEPTHHEDELTAAKWITGAYWHEHEVPSWKRPRISMQEARRLPRIRHGYYQRWRTVRDALAGLPDPTTSAAKDIQNHVLQPGARPYEGHTGSRLDLPAKTLKAGDHGVPGGENMLATEDGKYRYFTVRESARLQTFPDTYEFPTSWTESMRQIGNAVPVDLAQVVARSVRKALETRQPRKGARKPETAVNGKSLS